MLGCPAGIIGVAESKGLDAYVIIVRQEAKILDMRIGEVLRKWRRASDMGVREAAAEIGISHGTLSRIERGEDVDGRTMLKLIVWLMGSEKVERLQR